MLACELKDGALLHARRSRIDFRGKPDVPIRETESDESRVGIDTRPIRATRLFAIALRAFARVPSVEDLFDILSHLTPPSENLSAFCDHIRARDRAEVNLFSILLFIERDFPSTGVKACLPRGDNEVFSVLFNQRACLCFGHTRTPFIEILPPTHGRLP
jgi:hypothetical protein